MGERKLFLSPVDNIGKAYSFFKFQEDVYSRVCRFASQQRTNRSEGK